jgi:putative hydroxymethylpyrimidine transport system substrate-binding protein
MKFHYLVAAAVAAVVLLAGCGGDGGGETTEGQSPGSSRKASKPMPRAERDAWIALDGYRGPENVGILMAAERGYFTEAGISATITSPIEPANPLGYVLQGTVDFALVHQPEVVMARAEGKPVVAVGSVVPQPTAAMIWLESPEIDGLADLKGKTIAIPGVPFQEDLVESALAGAGLTLEDVKVEQVGFGLVPNLVSGRVDAIFGGSPNVEGAELESRGLKPVVIPAQRLGIPPYDELVVAARAGRLSKDPRLVRDLMSAVARGNAAAAEDPEGATELITGTEETDPKMSRKGAEIATEETLPLLSRTGRIDPGQAKGLGIWMREQGFIR